MSAADLEDGEQKREPLLARLEARARERLGRAAFVLPGGLFLLGWGYLNWLMNARLWDDASWLLAALRPSADATGALFVVCLLAFAGVKPRAVVWVPITALLVLSRVVFVGDEASQLLLGRPFDLSPDLSLVWELLLILEERVAMTTILLYTAGSAFGIGVSAFFAKQVLHLAGNVFVEKRARFVFGGLAVLLALIGLVTPMFDEVLTVRLAGHVAGLFGDDRREEAQARVDGALRGVDGDTDLETGGRHVFVIFVESYGSAALTEATHAADLRPVIEEAGTALRDDGWFVRSALVRPPDVSAVSELAWASVLSGVPIATRAELDVVLDSDLPTLADRFSESGYRTVLAVPGETREQQDGSRDWYGFGLTYYAWRFGYQGPPFGASPMPDQFVLDRIFRIEIEESEDPVFATWMLSSSQATFDEEPPYIEDWSTLVDGSTYGDSQKILHPVDLPRLTTSAVGWRSTLAYSIRSVRHFVTDVLPDPRPRRRRGRRRGRPSPLILLLGDHPPLAPVAGRPDPPLVPVHAMCRDEAVLAPFAGRGWKEGTIPTLEPPFDGTEQLGALLIEAFTPALEDNSETDD